MKSIKYYRELRKMLESKQFPQDFLEYKGVQTKRLGHYIRRVIRSPLVPRYFKKKIIWGLLEFASKEKKRDLPLWSEIVQNIYSNSFQLKSPWLNTAILQSPFRNKDMDSLVFADIKRKSNLGKINKFYSRVRALIYLHKLLIKTKRKEMKEKIILLEKKIFYDIAAVKRANVNEKYA